MKRNLAVFIISLLSLVMVSADITSASEGTVELRNHTGEAGRCFATSILMDDLQYKVLVSCRDIIYPGGTDIFHYIVWSDPVGKGTSERLGDLDKGKVELRTKNAFDSLFITKERNENVRTPSSGAVMSGPVQSIAFLDTAENATPTPNPDGETPQVSPSPKAKFKIQNLAAAGGAVGFIAIAGALLAVFLITRQ